MSRARQLGCSVGTVKSQAARGLARLREVTADTGSTSAGLTEGRDLPRETGNGTPAAHSKPGSSGPGLGGQQRPGGGPVAAPGTVLRDCASANGGTVDTNWKVRSIHAGPVWFIYARPPAGANDRPLRTGAVTASAMVIAVSNGKTAFVTAGSATHGRFRFLQNFHSGNAPYTLGDGAPGLTLSGCPKVPPGSGIPARYAPGLTMFWEGYVTGLRGCIPVEVRTTPRGRPVHVTIAALGCRR